MSAARKQGEAPRRRAKPRPPASLETPPAATESRPGEQWLRESAEYFHNLAEQSPSMIFINQRGRLIYANQRCHEVMGYTQQEALAPQFNFLALIAPESQDTVRDSFRRHLQGEEIPPYECTLLTKDGRKIRSIVTTKLIQHAGGQAILGVITDITERQQAEEALRRSEARLQAVLKVGNLGYLDWDLTSNQITWSDTTYRMYGFSPGAFSPTAESTVRLVHPEDKEYVEKHLSAAIRGESAYNIEHRMVRPDGRIIHIHATAEVTRDAQGKPLRMLGTVTDITERKQMEEALRLSESRLRTAFDNAPFEFWARDLEGRCLMQNAAATKHWGNMLGQRLEDSAISEETRAAWEANNRRAYAGEVVQGEVACLEHGEKRFYYNVVAPIRVGEEIRGILGFNIDITARKRAESALSAISGRLLKLQEEERRHLARELHDTTGQNLTAMNMHLSALKAAIAPTNGMATKALEECCRLTHQCVQEIRTFSYLLHPPVLDELGLGRALHDYAVGFQRRSGIKVELDLPTDADSLPREIEAALFRVVQESLGNIHRHSRSPTAAIRLWRDDGEIWLEVADAGRGIPPEVLQAAGAPDAQVGVGIAGMRERMSQLGGRLNIHSGRSGTTIQAVVPVKGTPKS